MKSILHACKSFSRVERLGFSVLALLLSAILAFRLWLGFQMEKRPPSPEDQRLAAIYDEWKQHNNLQKNKPSTSVTARQELFYFDPNTLDSAGFIRLGMSPRAVHGLLIWRRKGKQFRKPEDLAPLYNLPPELFAQLKPFIRIEAADNFNHHEKWALPALPKVIDLNTADSALLDRAVSGVGPALARKIVGYREALGGFLRFEQLLEIYRFPDSTFNNIKARCNLNPGKVNRMDLNEADEAKLSRHPYIGPKTAGNILLYRQGIGHYGRLEQLREVPLMSEEIYRKIAPYFIIK